MSEMVERVARALFAHQQFDADMVFEDFRDEYLGEARAAIEAMQTGECICPKCGLRHGITAEHGDTF